jgi:1-acyl-sn-glycerol-3-phosphate acyltransferase
MPLTTYRVAWWRRWLVRPLGKVGFRLLFRLLARVRLSGRDNVPFGRPYLVAINHVSIFDPPFALAFWPEMAEAMGAVEIWNRPGQNVLVRLYGGIPVHRYEFDRALFDRVLAVLEAGRPLMLAPEGGRSHAPGMRRARPGVAYIAEAARVPIVPVGIIGTTDDFWKQASRGHRPQIELRIGEPFELPPLEGRGADRRRARQRNADLILQRLAVLLPEEYRGVYDGRPLPEVDSRAPETDL